MGHVVLLGDSIFDNASYVPGRPPVIEQLRARLPHGGRAALLAVDGAVASDVVRQLQRLPQDATHLLVSVGGNDALRCSGMIHDTRRSTADAFTELAGVQERFRRDYRAMLQAVLARHKPTAICTIYDAVPGLARQAVTALSVFNDVICREGFQAGLPILDLRPICNEPGDYSALSPIEPSEIGGAKIAQGIVRIVADHDFTRGQCVAYGSQAT